MDRRVVVEIDLKALVRNYRRIAAHVKPAKVLCVLKANAYGLGVAPFARALGAAGCRNFGVAEPYEALELAAALKAAGVRDAEVQILSSVLPDEVEGMVRAGVTLPVTGLEGAKLISKAAAKLKRRARVHFKLDTGMGRLGILATGPGGVERALAEIRAAASLPGLDCEGIFSHCPVAYEPKNPFTPRQIALFKRVVAAAAKEGLRFRMVHMAASDAINNFPETARRPFTHVRTGINLHGSFDPNGRRALKVESVLTLIRVHRRQALSDRRADLDGLRDRRRDRGRRREGRRRGDLLRALRQGRDHARRLGGAQGYPRLRHHLLAWQPRPASREGLIQPTLRVGSVSVFNNQQPATSNEDEPSLFH